MNVGVLEAVYHKLLAAGEGVSVDELYAVRQIKLSELFAACKSLSADTADGIRYFYSFQRK